MKYVSILLVMLSFGFRPTDMSMSVLTIKFTGIRNTEGVFRLGFYVDQESFSKGEPLFEKVVPKSNISNGMLQVSFDDIKPSSYGIAVLDDENGDNKIDYGLIFPKEGFGFSDYYHTSLYLPKYDDFDFQLNEQEKTVTVKLRYL